jgi:hypothetical protein
MISPAVSEKGPHARIAKSTSKATNGRLLAPLWALAAAISFSQNAYIAPEERIVRSSDTD